MSNASSKGSLPSSQPPEVKSAIPWKPWHGLVYAIVVFIVAQFFSALVVSLLPSHDLYSVFAFLLLDAIFLTGALYGWLRYYNVGFSIIGLKKPRGRDLLYALSFFPLYFVLFAIVVVVVKALVPGLDLEQEQQLGFDKDVYRGLELAVIAISLVVLPPIVEELLFRGFIYSSFKKAVPIIWAALLTSGLFALGHLPEGGASGPLYIAGIDTFVLGMLLVWLRELTGSLWASMILHAIKNGIAFTLIFILHQG